MHRNEDGEVEQADGQDCTALPNIKGVECYSSKCVISELDKLPRLLQLEKPPD